MSAPKRLSSIAGGLQHDQSPTLSLDEVLAAAPAKGEVQGPFEGAREDVSGFLWGKPQPLAPEHGPAVPLSDLPPALRDIVNGLAAENQTAPEAVLNAALATVSMATRGFFDIRATESWSSENTVWWGTTLARSGERKDASMRPVMRPVREYEDHFVDRMIDVGIERAMEREDIELAVTNAESILKDAREKGSPDDIKMARAAVAQVRKELELFKPLGDGRFTKAEATTEALGVLMSKGGGSAGFFTTEAAVFNTVAGSYNNGVANVSLLNNAYDGVPYSDARNSRTPIDIKRGALTFCAVVQPAVLRGYGTSQTDGSGFLARHAWWVVPSRAGTLEYDNVPVTPKDSWDAWNKVVASVAQRVEPHYIQWMLNDRESSPLRLTFDEEAQALLKQVAVRIDRSRVEGSPYESITEWMSKQAGRVVRLAALLALIDDPSTMVVRRRWVQAAANISEAMCEHAVIAFAVLRGSVQNAPMRRVIEAMAAITEQERGERYWDGVMTTRDIHQKVRGQEWAKSVEAVKGVLQDLEALGWVKRVEKPVTEKGGRPSDRWMLNPHAMD